MKRLYLATAILLLASTAPSPAQTLDDLNIQLHGFATQSLAYSDHNSWNTTDSAHGSTAWSEAVINLSAQPEPRIRMGVQARYFLLGDYGNNITLDWAQADVSLNEHVGFRVGKVKTPAGLLNETQDIDPAHLWALLPQSVYPLSSRNSLLSHYGGLLYGSASAGSRLGSFEYRLYAGERIVDGSDGVLQRLRDFGLSVPNGIKGKMFGGTLRWLPPVRGLMLGTTWHSDRDRGEVDAGALSGTLDTGRIGNPYYFVRWERDGWMAAGEFSRLTLDPTISLQGQPNRSSPSNAHNWYVMFSCKVKPRWTVGAYYSDSLDHLAPMDQNRYQKDWTLSSRFDANPFLYVKAEQHLINGTAIGFDSSDNPTLATRTNLTLLKLGVTF